MFAQSLAESESSIESGSSSGPEEKAREQELFDEVNLQVQELEEKAKEAEARAEQAETERDAEAAAKAEAEAEAARAAQAKAEAEAEAAELAAAALRAELDGTFNITNKPITSFAGWGATTGAKFVSGDFNGDGKSDLALTGGSGWSTQPVAFAK